jgi:hypothetical protein
MSTNPGNKISMVNSTQLFNDLALYVSNYRDQDQARENLVKYIADLCAESTRVIQDRFSPNLRSVEYIRRQLTYYCKYGTPSENAIVLDRLRILDIFLEYANCFGNEILSKLSKENEDVQKILVSDRINNVEKVKSLNDTHIPLNKIALIEEDRRKNTRLVKLDTNPTFATLFIVIHRRFAIGYFMETGISNEVLACKAQVYRTPEELATVVNKYDIHQYTELINKRIDIAMANGNSKFATVIDIILWMYVNMIYRETFTKAELKICHTTF